MSLRTSLEFIGNTAYVFSLMAEIWKLDSVSPRCVAPRTRVGRGGFEGFCCNGRCSTAFVK